MRRPSKERLQRALGFSLFLSGAIFLFSYLTFPWDVLRERVEVELGTALKSGDGEPVQVAIGSLRPSWFTGISVRKLLITRKSTQPDAPDRSLLIPEFTLRIELLSLFRSDRTIDFSSSLFGGSLKGKWGKGKQEAHLKVEATGLDLGQAPELATLTGIDLSGRLNAQADVSFKEGDLTSLKGPLTLAVDNGALKGGKIGEFELPGIALGKVDIRLTADAGKLTVEALSIKGEDLDASVEGGVLLLNRSFSYSTLRGTVRAHFAPELLKRIPYLGLGLGALKPPDRDGVYILPLNGTLANPRVM
jgi:type II secretion system protein N